MDIFDLSGNTVRELREGLSWSREFLSEKSGVPARTIQDVEMGVTKNPGLETFKALFKVMPNYPQNKEDRAQRVLDLQSKLLTMSEDDFEIVETTVENLSSDTQRSTKVGLG